MKKVLLLFGLLAVVAFGGTFLQNNLKNGSFTFLNSPKAVINNQTFKLIVAKKPEEKQTGLSNKQSLEADKGMLFPFEKADYYAFWMKNMKFPIDMIYIKNNKVVTVYQNVQPPKSNEENLAIFKPKEPADKVLEINAGLTEKYSIKEGDEIRIEGL